MQQTEIWLVILFLLRKKFHAKQIFVLTGFMKLGPENFSKCSSTWYAELFSMLDPFTLAPYVMAYNL